VDANSRVRLSLAGLQRKAVLVRSGSAAFGRPSAAAPSTHIVKPQYSDTPYRHLVYNERFCMRVAECVGLEVARTDLIFIGEHPCVLVERFDRSTDGAATVRRHQEDFCQALGFAPGIKYEAEGGPTMANITDVLRDVSVRAAQDVLAFVRAVIVNYVLGNSDAHGKNFALLYGETGPRLAPLYDIVSSGVYAEIDDSMAMALGGEFDPEAVGPANVRRLAEQCGLSANAMAHEWESIAARTASCAAGMAGQMKAEGLHVPEIDKIVALAKSRAALDPHTM
jgi:serine/threonine-protein kinase HipA